MRFMPQQEHDARRITGVERSSGSADHPRRAARCRDLGMERYVRPHAQCGRTLLCCEWVARWFVERFRQGRRDCELARRFEREELQIFSGYYDHDEDGTAIATWLANTEKVPGIVGAMYTTWEDKYGAMDKWAAT